MLKTTIRIDEVAVFKAASKYIMDNVRHIGDPDFPTDLTKFLIEEVKRVIQVDMEREV